MLSIKYIGTMRRINADNYVAAVAFLLSKFTGAMKNEKP